MTTRFSKAVASVVVVILLLGACRDGDESSTTTTASSTTTESPPAPFPVEAFAAFREAPVSDEQGSRFQAALDGVAGQDAAAEGWGLTATVMTTDGTWSGAVGKADGVRDLQVDDQFAVASITKSVLAAQVMSMVEAGEIGLEDRAADHLPPDFRFDTNGATIRDLLGHRSGLPDYYDLINTSQETEVQRVWTSAEILELIPAGRRPPGKLFEYAETNFLVLGLVIEHLRGRSLGDVLREGVLDVDGTARLVFQPDERPTEPIALPDGASTADLVRRGGFIPSLAAVTAFHWSGAIASDSLSLARWWKALCAGEIVSKRSLTEMSTFTDGQVFDGAYGLGLYNPAHGYAEGIGHTGELFGYMSWAACLPEDGAVIVVLTNRRLRDGQFAFSHGMARPLVEALRQR